MDRLEDFEPLDYYKNRLSGEFENNAKNYFDDLVKKSGVDPAANAAAVKKYDAAFLKAQAAEKKLSSGKVLRGFVIFFTVAAFIAAVVLLVLYFGGNSAVALLICGILCAVLGVVGIAVLFTALKKMIAARQKKYDKAAAYAEKLKGEAFDMLRPLHALFTWDMTRELLVKSFPDLELDERLSVQKLDLFCRKYGYRPSGEDRDSSTLFLLSGNIEGNPFLFERQLRCRIVPHTYTGSLTIHWTTTSTDSNGHSHTVHHSQTLYANVEKPAPEYGEETRLYYGNEAAPDLTFSRTPKYSHTHDEEELEKIVKKGGKKLAAKTRKAAASGGGFTEIANTEFEVLFGATDRNNEVQFRLMFTPLAQNNMTELMTSDEGYGDDFAFIKNGMLNCIRSDHAQYWQTDADPARYVSHSLEDSRAAFMAYNTEYLKSVYFDFAPLLSVPLYRMQKPHEFIYRDVYGTNYALPQSEVLANRLGAAQFAPAEAKTQSILKASFVQKDGLSDKVLVTAYSYDTINRVDYVDVFGGDGRIHAVPVPWIEYIPIDRTDVMEVKAVGGTRDTYERMRSESSLASFVRRFSANGASAYSDGLMAIPADAVYGAGDDEELGGIFGLQRAAAGAAAFMAGVAAVERAADMLDKAEADDRAAGKESPEGEAAATDETEGKPDGSDK